MNEYKFHAMPEFVGSFELTSTILNDLKEVEVCFGAGSWKSCIVLCGSIIECLLLDLLLANGYSTSNESDLKLPLAKLIDAAFERHLISPEIKRLSEEIKDYRNLIHFGRELRTGQKCDRERTMITVAMLSKVIDEFNLYFANQSSFNAQQLLDSVLESRDIAIATNLFTMMSTTQQITFLTQTCPKSLVEYSYVVDQPELYSFNDPSIVRMLSQLFRRIVADVRLSQPVREATERWFFEIFKSKTYAEIARLYSLLFHPSLLSHQDKPVKTKICDYLVANPAWFLDKRVTPIGTFIAHFSDAQIKIFAENLISSAINHPTPCDSFRPPCQLSHEFKQSGVKQVEALSSQINDYLNNPSLVLDGRVRQFFERVIAGKQEYDPFED